MKKISFICCYTKEDLLNDFKKSTDCLTDYEIEWVLIDNRNNRFKSAASALNYGFNKSTSPIVIFYIMISFCMTRLPSIGWLLPVRKAISQDLPVSCPMAVNWFLL